MEQIFDKYINMVQSAEPIKYTGRVTAVKGSVIESKGPSSVIGEMCTIKLSNGTEMLAEVVGFRDTTVQLMPYGETRGIELGSEVVASGNVMQVPVGDELLGRVIDATCKPFDGLGEIHCSTYYPVLNTAPNPMTRKMVDRRITTGVRCLDSMLTIAKGQRIGIFAGSGVGKTTLMSTIARNTNADINVIGLIGERGREVLNFIKKDLGEEGLKRSVVVVATGDSPSIARLRAAYVTTAIAEYFRDQGKDVMLMMDNLTRFCHAQREIMGATGEFPTQRGYPPSVFEILPKLLERTGNNEKGTITAFYNVLVDGGDFDEPVSDKVRGTLDGHIILSRELAEEKHYPAIDVLASISRCADDVVGPKTHESIRKVAKWISDYNSQKRMIIIGAYEKGSSPAVDEAIQMHDEVEKFLCQEKHEKCTMEDTLKRLSELSGIEIPEEEYLETAGIKD